MRAYGAGFVPALVRALGLDERDCSSSSGEVARHRGLRDGLKAALRPGMAKAKRTANKTKSVAKKATKLAHSAKTKASKVAKTAKHGAKKAKGRMARAVAAVEKKGPHVIEKLGSTLSTIGTTLTSLVKPAKSGEA
jgi:hypothetical protein